MTPKQYFRAFLIILYMCLPGHLLADDFLMLRNGEEYNGKLEVISDKEVSFSTKSGGLFSSNSQRNVFPTNDVYMIKTDKRGTIFFNRKHQRSVVPTVKIDKSADLIYLADGGELQGWQVVINNGILSYQKNPKQKRAMSNIGAIDLDEVFMIKYSDGSKDIFTDITVDKAEEEQAAVPVPVVEPEKIKVILYNTRAGETLGTVAEKYNVSVEDIIEWNDLPARYKSTTKLSSGMQLMIQTKTTN